MVDGAVIPDRVAIDVVVDPAVAVIVLPVAGFARGRPGCGVAVASLLVRVTDDHVASTTLPKPFATGVANTEALICSAVAVLVDAVAQDFRV
jgi:hypothetical protein